MEMDIAKECFNYALRVLVRKDYTEKQMTQKLLQRYAKLHKNMIEKYEEEQKHRETYLGLEFLGIGGETCDDTNQSMPMRVKLDGDCGGINTDASTTDAIDNGGSASEPLDEGAMLDTVETIVGELKGMGYIDDERYALGFVRGQSKKYGEHRIRQGLKSRGIEPREQMFADMENSTVAMDTARAVAQKYALRNRRKDLVKIRSGLYSHLIYRGFSSDVVAEITKSIMDDMEAGRGE